MKSLKLKNIAQYLVLTGAITFSAAGVAIAAGAGDQTGQQGDMSGQGGPIDKKAGAEGGQKSGTAPEPGTYRQSGGSSQGAGSAGSKEEKEKLDRNVQDTVKRDQAHKLKPSEYDPPK